MCQLPLDSSHQRDCYCVCENGHGAAVSQALSQPVGFHDRYHHHLFHYHYYHHHHCHHYHRIGSVARPTQCDTWLGPHHHSPIEIAAMANSLQHGHTIPGCRRDGGSTKTSFVSKVNSNSKTVRVIFRMRSCARKDASKARCCGIEEGEVGGTESVAFGRSE